jgi:hypothetical protein
MQWVATPLLYVRYRCYAGTDQALAVDKSAISAKNGRKSRGLASRVGRLAQQWDGNRRAPEIYSE